MLRCSPEALGGVCTSSCRLFAAKQPIRRWHSHVKRGRHKRLRIEARRLTQRTTIVHHRPAPEQHPPQLLEWNPVRPFVLLLCAIVAAAAWQHRRQQPPAAPWSRGLDVEAAGSQAAANQHVHDEDLPEAMNLGRVVFCATLGYPAEDVDLATAPLQQLAAEKGIVDGPLTGLCVVYPNCLLCTMEGDNNFLFAILRGLLPENVYFHGLQDVRVVSFISDARSRLYNEWYTATARRAGGRPRRSANVLQEPAWLKAVDGVELFVKLMGARLALLQGDQARLNAALADLSGFDRSLPEAHTVWSLACTDPGPTLPAFLAQFDVDYERYKTLLKWGVPQNKEMAKLARLYGKHAEVEQAQQQRREAQQQQQQGAADAGRLSRYYPKKPPRSPPA